MKRSHRARRRESAAEFTWIPNDTLPEQLARGPVASPERQLLIAVLQQALADAAGRGWDGHVHRPGAIEWLESDDTTWPASFVNVCAMLDLEPGSVKRYLSRRPAA